MTNQRKQYVFEYLNNIFNSNICWIKDIANSISSFLLSSIYIDYNIPVYFPSRLKNMYLNLSISLSKKCNSHTLVFLYETKSFRGITRSHCLLNETKWERKPKNVHNFRYSQYTPFKSHYLVQKTNNIFSNYYEIF